MRRHRRYGGYTVVELKVVLVLLGAIASIAMVRYLDLRDEASEVSVRAQAANLIQQNELNFAACQVEAPGCIEFSTTGFTNPGVCQDAIAQFLAAAGRHFEATTYSSSTPRDRWRNLPDADEALFWVTRTVDVPHPQTVPCTLAHRS